MASALARRIARLEQRHAPVVPAIIECDDDLEAAIAGHTERYGHAPAIIVPARCREDELELQEQRWAKLQRELIRAAKSETKSKEEGNDNGHDTRRNARSHTSSRRILSASGATNSPRPTAWKPG
jgi:hypothetical protein